MNEDIYEVSYADGDGIQTSIRLVADSIENAKNIFEKTFAQEPNLISYCGKRLQITDCCEGAPNE